jgi:prophage regulatory protein
MTEKRLIPLPEVTRLTGLKRTAIYERIARKDFPPAIKLGSTSRWPLSEVEAWIDAKVLARDGNKVESNSAPEK